MGRAKKKGSVIYVRVFDEVKADLDKGRALAGHELTQHVAWIVSLGWLPDKHRKWLREIAEEENRTPFGMLALIVKLAYEKEEG